jgi:hypothetical protein
MMLLFFVLILLPGLFIFFDFIYFLIKNKHFLNKAIYLILEIATLIALPYLFLSFADFGLKNDCCSESAFFSPDHRITIYFLVVACIVAYFYSAYRKNIATPVLEIVINCFLLIGIALNVIIAIQANETFLWIIGNIPIILLFILKLIKNHHLFIETSSILVTDNVKLFEKICWAILTLKPFQKYPILVMLCMPILILIIALLLIFGQKPDSIIKVFTDTYHQGLSKLDCTNVQCPDGHFLCTVAASGHKKFVKPLRIGIRHGYQIKVNRQLLISNAFEELMEEKIPLVHKYIRIFYNIAGGNFQKLYIVLGSKWIADAVYLVMKPLEIFFLLILYTFDKKPEDRIAKQYIKGEDKLQIETALLNS